MTVPGVSLRCDCGQRLGTISYRSGIVSKSGVLVFEHGPKVSKMATKLNEAEIRAGSFSAEANHVLEREYISEERKGMDVVLSTSEIFQHYYAEPGYLVLIDDDFVFVACTCRLRSESSPFLEDTLRVVSTSELREEWGKARAGGRATIQLGSLERYTVIELLAYLSFGYAIVEPRTWVERGRDSGPLPFNMMRKEGWTEPLLAELMIAYENRSSPEVASAYRPFFDRVAAEFNE